MDSIVVHGFSKELCIIVEVLWFLLAFTSYYYHLPILIIPRVLCGNRAAYTVSACDVLLGENSDVWTKVPS